MLVQQAVLNAMMANPTERNILEIIDTVSKLGNFSVEIDYKVMNIQEETYAKLAFLGYGVFVAEKLHISWKPVYGFNGEVKIANS